MLQPGSATYSVAATGGTIVVPVTRVAGAAGAVGCSYTTVNGSAVAGVDYTAVSGTLSWANNDSAAKNIVITILDDGVANGNKTFSLQLHTPTGGAYLGVPPTTPATNHEGRVLGSLPLITVPVDWNTATADGILQTLQILPANNPWNEDISGLPVAADSALIIAAINGGSTFIHVNRDMNLTIIPGTQGTKTVPLSLYGSESDPGPYRVPDNLPIEGFKGDDKLDFPPNGRTLPQIQQNNPFRAGDRHGTILDPVNGYIYEFGNMFCDAAFNWSASGEATFALYSNVTRQANWTSADAAGLPILPSIPRYDECQRGMVEHALRFTAQSKSAYVWPATHKTGTDTANNRPRMGERFRLKNTTSVNNKINLMDTHPRAIAKALQKYGMFMADNGSNWYLSTNSDDRLVNLNHLQTLRGDDFDVVVTTGPHEGPRATSTTAITVTDSGGGGGDSTPPSCAVTSPTSSTTYTSSTTPQLFGGTAADNVGVTSVSWTNSAGGSGTASGTTSWSALIPLVDGTNTLTFTAHDANGNNASDVLTVSYTAPPASLPGGGGGSGGGGCGLSGLELLPLLLLRRFRRG